jgi:hypothetical protein
MNIYYDVNALTRETLTGVGLYTAELAAHLGEIENLHIRGCMRVSRWKKLALIQKHFKLPIDVFSAVTELMHPSIHLIHGPDFRIPRHTLLKKVVTVHDLVVFQEGISEPGFAARSQKKFRYMIEKCRPDQIITVSESVRTELIALYPEL